MDRGLKFIGLEFLEANYDGRKFEFGIRLNFCFGIEFFSFFVCRLLIFFYLLPSVATLYMEADPGEGGGTKVCPH